MGGFLGSRDFVVFDVVFVTFFRLGTSIWAILGV